VPVTLEVGTIVAIEVNANSSLVRHNRRPYIQINLTQIQNLPPIAQRTFWIVIMLQACPRRAHEIDALRPPETSIITIDGSTQTTTSARHRQLLDDARQRRGRAGYGRRRGRRRRRFLRSIAIGFNWSGTNRYTGTGYYHSPPVAEQQRLLQRQTGTAQTQLQLNQFGISQVVESNCQVRRLRRRVSCLGSYRI
jgi:hypothetical protein